MNSLGPRTRWVLHFGLQISFCAILAACFPVSRRQSTTIVLPDNVSNHGSENLICTPSGWTDVALFYLGNYVAHAATVRVSPGEPILDRIVNSIAVLLFPQAGAMKGLNAIFRCAVLENSPLQRAARAGALCMVVRTPEWKPMPSESIQGVSYMGLETMKAFNKNYLSVKFNENPVAELNELRNLEEPVATNVWIPPWIRPCSKMFWMYTDTLFPWVPWGREIHGVCKLPEGYTLAFVPRHAKVRTKPLDVSQGNGLEERFDSTISASFSTIKAIVAILQTLYASFTLYRTRGDQLTQYGYAAFGLTVTPYLVMSIINLIGNLVTPEYAALYMVRSDVMKEARGRGAVIDGEVGEIIPDDYSNWTFGVPNQFSGSFTSMEENRLGLTNITYSSSNTTIRQPADIEPTNKLESTDIINNATSTILPEDHVDDDKKVSAIGSDEEPIVEPDATIELQLMRAENFKEDSEFKPKPTLMIPSCGNFATTRRPVNNLPTGISDISQLSLHQRSRVNHSALIMYLVIQGVNLVITGISIAVIGGLSGFHKGNSTVAQRVWTMMWLAFGFLMGPNFVALPSATAVVKLLRSATRKDQDPDSWRYFFAWGFISTLIYGIPGFGGYVVVGKMLYEYGNCISID
ncbi:uncharacterized protein GGS22DRAFT_139616 [Annulohypoxylon maeteangense]|uniref:uncharacterized protein n=1 Tax=Annulohypoxylon maeteangense TaxID=1927788 RepID=UPI00200887B9|nr:uncharacterized protein GGS22DRAFT_139616 [Annulohypoxylon maeteangense]KAI0885161.1 hypothetical protein GGS22DRAFT_139616 [Annulohypoxylon maeteangense]